MQRLLVEERWMLLLLEAVEQPREKQQQATAAVLQPLPCLHLSFCCVSGKRVGHRSSCRLCIVQQLCMLYQGGESGEGSSAGKHGSSRNRWERGRAISVVDCSQPALVKCEDQAGTGRHEGRSSSRDEWSWAMMGPYPAQLSQPRACQCSHVSDRSQRATGSVTCKLFPFIAEERKVQGQ
jgi:hypothetical protein